MFIDGYKITKVYPHLVEGVDSNGHTKTFQIQYALLSPEARLAQDAYWAEQRTEFSD